MLIFGFGITIASTVIVRVGCTVLTVHSYGCGLLAAVQKASASGYAHCRSSDASLMRAEMELSFFIIDFSFWLFIHDTQLLTQV